jgi:Transposase DDE domain
MCKNAALDLILAVGFSRDLREDRMRRFIEGADRSQSTLFPECLEDWIDEDNARLISRWEHEHVLEAVQRLLDEHPEKMRQRRETVEHPFGTIKARMGATHFLMKTLPRVASEMALHVLAYNLTRVMNIMGTGPLIAAMRA